MKLALTTCIAITQCVMLTSCSEQKEPIEPFVIEDCLIAGLKGVTSDTAAIMVKQACKAKEKAYKDKIEDAKYDSINEIYGRKIAADSIKYEGWHKGENYWHISFKSKIPDGGPNISYIRIRVGVGGAQSAFCTSHKDMVFKVNIAPGEYDSVLISPFHENVDGMCVTINDVRSKYLSIYDRAKYFFTGNPLGEQLDEDPYGQKLDTFIEAVEAASAASDADAN